MIYAVQIGSIIETPVFYGNFDARKNLHLHAEYMGAGHDRIDEALSLFDLVGAENKPVKNFSLGMKQRLALARAILTKPKLLILDEPVNGLDSQGINAMREILLKINREEKTTILISSHILSELEKTNLGENNTNLRFNFSAPCCIKYFSECSSLPYQWGN